MSDGVKQAAVALAEMAAKDDRQMEEMRCMADVSARHGERILQLLTQSGEKLEEISSHCSAMCRLNGSTVATKDPK